MTREEREQVKLTRIQLAQVKSHFVAEGVDVDIRTDYAGSQHDGEWIAFVLPPSTVYIFILAIALSNAMPEDDYEKIVTLVEQDVTKLNIIIYFPGVTYEG